MYKGEGNCRRHIRTRHPDRKLLDAAASRDPNSPSSPLVLRCSVCSSCEAMVSPSTFAEHVQLAHAQESKVKLLTRVKVGTLFATFVNAVLFLMNLVWHLWSNVSL